MIGNKTGKLGEDIAAEFLLCKGYKVIHRNYWKPYGEIDIVCEKQDVTHFVEVKSVVCLSIPNCGANRLDDLSNVSYENIRPEDNLHKDKLRKLENVIQAYISTFHVKDWVFDVVIVYIDRETKKARVRKIENQILEGK